MESAGEHAGKALLKMERFKLVLLITSLFLSQISALLIEGAIGIAVVSAFTYLGRKVMYSEIKESCNDEWLAPNITGLQSSLRSRVFGQHLATETVLKAVVGHLNNESPSKALVLSFNGWTGSGKTFVSNIVAEHIFKRGLESSFVQKIVVPHRYPSQSNVELHKRELRDLVTKSVSECPRSLFIFDETNKMPIGLIDVLSPYLDHYLDVEKIDYRKSIFIFLSNAGGSLINDAVINHWKEGMKREDITIKQMEVVINRGEFNKKGGFWHSSVIENNLIDHFIPFMPLERSHIKMCAKADLEQKGHPVTEQILNNVADELIYFPDDLKVFSVSGCKRVSGKVDLIMG